MLCASSSLFKIFEGRIYMIKAHEAYSNIFNHVIWFQLASDPSFYSERQNCFIKCSLMKLMNLRR